MMDDDRVNIYDQAKANFERNFGPLTVTPAEYSEAPFSRGRMCAFLDDDGQLDAVKWVVKWQMGWNTSQFARALERAIVCADPDNLAKLAKGFPNEVTGFLDYRVGRLAEKLHDAGILQKGRF